MQHTENINGIKLDVQTVNVNIDDQAIIRLRELISRIVKRYPELTHADIYLEDKEHKSTNSKSVSIRLGVPGKDPFASHSGDNFSTLLIKVEKKLFRQLEKRN